MKTARPPWLGFEPRLMEKVWGGDKLVRLLGKPGEPGALLGESWEVSQAHGSVSVVARGPLRGLSLAQLWAERPELFGLGAGGREFPLLVKFIHARELLSVQVHPGDGDEPGRGKTEAWVIIHAEPGAFMYKGLNRAVDRGEVRSLIESGRLESTLNRVPVRAGDALFVPGGAVHAIGAGVVLLEVQQSSDVTYRFHDWGRVGLDGEPRELHIEAGLRVMDPGADAEGTAPGVEIPVPAGRLRLAVACPYFALEVGEGAGAVIERDPERFQILSVLGGKGWIEADGDREPAAAGRTFLVTAGLGPVELSLPGGGRWARVYEPGPRRELIERLVRRGVAAPDAARAWREPG